MLRQREDQLAAAREDAERQLVRRKVDLPTSEDIRAYVADFWEFLEGGTFPERKALIRNFVQGIEVSGDEAELTYTIPMPAGGATSERAAVLDFVSQAYRNSRAWGRVRVWCREGPGRGRPGCR